MTFGVRTRVRNAGAKSQRAFAFPRYIFASFFIFLSAAQFVQAQRLWQKIGNLQQQRRLFGALAFSSRQIMVMGGYTASAQITASCEIIDVETKRILPASRMNAARAESVFLLTSDSNIVAISGVTSGDNVTPLCELYNRSTMMWAVIGRLLIGRRQHVACFLNANEILIVGGRDGNINTIKSAEVFNIHTGQSRFVADYPMQINLGQCGISSRNRPLVFSGRSGGENSSRSAEVYEYDLANNGFHLVSNIKDGLQAAYSIKLTDGRLLLSGGSRSEKPIDYSKSVYLEGYPKFQEIAQTTFERSWHSMAQWNADTVMILGGFNNNSTAMASTEWVDVKRSRAVSAPTMVDVHSRFVAVA